MFKILEAEQLSANVYKQVILAPRVAKSCEPGQFIILRIDERGERMPLTEKQEQLPSYSSPSVYLLTNWSH